MANRKQIPNGLAKRYIAVDAELHEIQATCNKLKSRLDTLVAKGFTSSLLEIIPVDRASIPWKEVAEELAAKFFGSKAEVKAWKRRVIKKYPAKPIAPTIRAAFADDEEEAA